MEAIEGKKLAETDEMAAFIQQLSDKSPAFLGLDNVLLALEQRIRTTDARKNPFIDFEKDYCKLYMCENGSSDIEKYSENFCDSWMVDLEQRK